MFAFFVGAKVHILFKSANFSGCGAKSFADFARIFVNLAHYFVNASHCFDGFSQICITFAADFPKTTVLIIK
jgi:hypothetical protein